MGKFGCWRNFFFLSPPSKWPYCWSPSHSVGTKTSSGIQWQCQLGCNSVECSTASFPLCDLVELGFGFSGFSFCHRRHRFNSYPCGGKYEKSNSGEAGGSKSLKKPLQLTEQGYSWWNCATSEWKWVCARGVFVHLQETWIVSMIVG